LSAPPSLAVRATAAALLVTCAAGVLTGALMTVWTWRRPAAVYPEPRSGQMGPMKQGEIQRGAGALAARPLDEARTAFYRDLAAAFDGAAGNTQETEVVR
jgi:hypothetical protein